MKCVVSILCAKNAKYEWNTATFYNEQKMEKTISEIIEEVKSEIYNEFCKYAKECDKEIEEKGEITRYCPLDKL